MRSRKKVFPVSAVSKLLLSIPQLQELLKSHATALNVGMGLLRGEQEVTGFWPISFSSFCQLIRRSPEGHGACQKADAKAGRTCSDCPVRKSKEDFDRFRCHMGLVDLPAPIYIRGRYLCHMFMGQIRDVSLNEETKCFLRKRHADLLLADAGIEFSELLGAYKKLRHRSVREIRQIDRVLRALAETIGIIAEHIYSLQSINELSLHLSPIAGIETGLTIIYDTVARLLGVDSGSIWLARREANAPPAFGYATVLRPLIMRWFGGSEDEKLKEKLVLPYGKGLGGLIAKKKKPITWQTVSEITNIPAVHPELRSKRRLRSGTLSPIMSQRTLLGFIELGSKEEKYFNDSNQQLVRTVAAIGANFVKRTKERSLILEMHRMRSETDLFRYLEGELPLLFGSLAATFYVPREISDRKVLVPVFPDLIVQGVGPGAQKHGWIPNYDLEAGEGLTGWVGKYLCPIRLKDCANKKEIKQLYDSGRLRTISGEKPPCLPIWKGKTRAKTEVKIRRKTYPILICPSYDESGQLLAVLRICEREGDFFSQADEDFAMDVCKQLAICLANIDWRQKESVRIAREKMGATIGIYTHRFNRSIQDATMFAGNSLKVAQQNNLPFMPFQQTLEAVEGLFRELEDLVKTVEKGEKWEIQPQEASIHSVLAKVIDIHRATWSQKLPRINTNLDIAPDAELATVCTDLKLMENCVGDILDNCHKAIKLSEVSAGIISVNCALSDNEKFVHITFEDNGVGFDEETLSKVNTGLPLNKSKRFGYGISLQGCKIFVERFLLGKFLATNRSEQTGACIEWKIPFRKEVWKNVGTKSNAT